MENKIKFVNHELTTRRWINNGWAVVGEKEKLSNLKVGDFFLKDNLICFINVTSKPYISYYDLIMREHSTSNTSQFVKRIFIVGENGIRQGNKNERN